MDERRRRRGLLEQLRDGATPTRVIASLGLAATLLAALSLPAAAALASLSEGGFEAVRLRLGFDAGAYGLTADGLRRYIAALQQGEETRRFLTFRAPLDLLLPLAYGPALMMLALSPLRARAARRKLAPPSSLVALALIPLLAATADMVENMTLIWLVVETPPGADALDPIAQAIALTATPLKMIGLAAAVALIFVTRIAPSPFFARSWAT